MMLGASPQKGGILPTMGLSPILSWYFEGPGAHSYNNGASSRQMRISEAKKWMVLLHQVLGDSNDPIGGNESISVFVGFLRASESLSCTNRPWKVLVATLVDLN